jgi:Domain of unknown function (DUF4349)
MLVLRNPLINGLIATIIVLVIGVMAATRLPSVQRQSAASSSQVEHVMVTKPMSLYAPPAPVPRSASATQIARTGSASLYVTNVDKAVQSLSQIARRQNGDVFSLQLDNGDAQSSNGSAQMQIRVPASRFDSTMSALSSIGTVRNRGVTAEDLTDNITDSDARLRNLQRTEADIRKIMDRSGSVSQVLDAENQLSQVREQIEQLEAELKSMHGRVAYATITIDLKAEMSRVPVQPTAVAQLSSAWHAAVAALSQTTIGLAAVLMWLLVFAPYAAALAGLAALVYMRRRYAR